MSDTKKYDDIVRTLTGVTLHNKSFLDLLHSSEKLQASLRGAVGPLDAFLKEASRVPYLYKSLPAIRNMVSSPALQFARTANMDISKLTGISNIGAMIRQIGEISNPWQQQLAKIGFAFRSTEEAQLGLQSYFSQISKMSLLAEYSIAGLDFAKIGLQLGLAQQIKASFQSELIAISNSFRNLYGSVDLPEFNPLRFHPVVTSMPPIEYYNHARIVELFTLDVPSESKERADLDFELSDDSQDVLTELLTILDPNLIPIWSGANAALDSSNPDKVRHFSASLREMHTHILRLLAPDIRINEWSKDPSHYDDKGKPTRKARMLYICRNINHPPFSDFVSKDIQTVIALFDLFQRGTHEMRSEFTDAQLLAMRLRAEYSIRFILEIGLRTNGK
jgi:hypothetical protein